MAPPARLPRPGVLTAFQEEVARLLSALPEASGFALAGGAALILRGDVDRATEDLDFFAPPPSQVETLLPALRHTLPSAITVEPVQVGNGFARLIVRRDHDALAVDIGIDARIRPVDRSPLGPVLAGEELAGDKLLALFGCAEPRDFVNVAALEPRYGLEGMCRSALEKDRGFRRDVLGAMLERFDRLSPADFGVDVVRYSAIQRAVQRWRTELAAGPTEPHRWPRRHGPGPDTSAGL